MPPLQRPPPSPASQLAPHSRSFHGDRTGVYVPLPARPTCSCVRLQGLAGARPSLGTRVTTADGPTR